MFQVLGKKRIMYKLYCAKSLREKGQVVKLKFVDRNVYGIIAEYIEINRQPYVLEIVCHTEENILLSSYGNHSS